MPVMSDRLRAMIDTYQERTRQYGAPNKKIRLPPSLVALCIRFGSVKLKCISYNVLWCSKQHYIEYEESTQCKVHLEE